MSRESRNMNKPNVKGLDAVGMRKGLRKGVPDSIKKIIAVHSGKGGVGKTFVAVHLALYLAKEGLRVGLLDADIDCPNVMKMLRIDGILKANGEKKIVPLEKMGVQVVSVAPMLQQEDQVLLWRGPILSKVVEQLIHDVAWPALDYLIVDLPPGTSDIPISILQMLDQAQVLLVTTPQELALLDARKSYHLAKKMQREVIGIVENMSGDLFGGGDQEVSSTKKLAKELAIQFLGSIPLDASFAQPLKIDTGTKLRYIFRALIEANG